MNESQQNSLDIESFFSESLLKQSAYAIDRTQTKVKLDQNESPSDWPLEIKKRVLDNLKAKAWNKYPDPFDEELSSLIANFAGVPDDKWVLTGPGSNFLITLLMQAISKKLDHKIIISFPSFPLYESYAEAEGLSYQRWNLDDHFSFDLNSLPNLNGKSLLIFASPNNPVGNSMSIQDLDAILKSNPQRIVIADEAYVEFSDKPYTELLLKYDNLILIRTFSKTLSAASVRLGYALAHPRWIQQLKKLRLPYLLNSFTLEAAKTILSHKEFLDVFYKNVEQVKKERTKLEQTLSCYRESLNYRFVSSSSNFVLLKFNTQNNCDLFYKKLLEASILVRNISKHPGMQACLRISIGSPSDNQALIECISKM